MASFERGGALGTPFGKNVYLRSTRAVKFEHYTLAAASITPQTIDGNPGQKIVQPGLVLAKITSGPDAGKVGPLQSPGTTGVNEVQTLTKTGTVTGGTFVLGYNGQNTAPLAFDSTAAQVQDALNGLQSVADAGGVTVTGGPLNTGPFTVTTYDGVNVNQISADTAGLTGTTPGITAATGTQGVAGANDGRQTLAGIVGINDTYLPWQTIHRDVEVAVAYDAAAVQGWCFEYDANGLMVPLSNTSAAAMQRGGAAGKSVDISWK